MNYDREPGEMDGDRLKGVPDDALPLTAPTKPEDRKRGFRLLFVALLAQGMGQSMMYAILPPLARQLGMSEFQTGAVFLVSAFIWVFVSPWWGRKSDVWGRRPVILIGLLGYAVSTLLFALTIEAGLRGWIAASLVPYGLIAMRSIYGIFGSGASPASQAYVADRTSREERTRWVSMLGAAFALGATVGPGVSSALVEISLLTPLYFVVAWSATAALAVWFILPERSLPRAHERKAKLKWTDRRIMPHLAAGTAMGTVQATVMQTIGFYVMDVLLLNAGESASSTGIGLMASSMAALLAQLVIVQRFNLSARTLLRWGCAIALASIAVLLMAHTLGQLVLAMVLSGLGFGMARPGNVAAASLAVGRREQGAVAGLTGATGAIGYIIAPLVCMPLYSINHATPFWLCLGLMVALTLFVLIHRDKGDDQEGVSGPEDPDPPFPAS